MDVDAKRTTIRVRLEKARDDLAAARALLQTAHWRAAVNRAYYTIFHVTSAALLWLNVSRSKHSGIQSAFGEFLVKPSLIEREYADIYADAREWREEQDYRDIARPLDEATATQIVQDAERFITRLERYLREVGAIE